MLNITRFVNGSELKLRYLQKLSNTIDVLSKKIDGLGEKSLGFISKIFIVKFVITLITILVMMSLFVSNLHVFSSLTIQFNEWVSSSLIAFTISIIVVKFIAISICLILFSLKQSTLENMILSIKNLKTLRLPAFIWNKVHYKVVK